MADGPPPTWVFDVDGCLIDSLTGASLRPGAADLLGHLKSAGATVLVWSAGGADYARERLSAQGLEHLIDAFLGKEARDGNGHYVWGGADGAVFVDDRPEDFPPTANLIAVPPYIDPNRHDRGLAAVLDQAGASWSGGQLRS